MQWMWRRQEESGSDDEQQIRLLLLIDYERNSVPTDGRQKQKQWQQKQWWMSNRPPEFNWLLPVVKEEAVVD